MFWNETREDILNNITNYIRHGAYPFCAEPAFLREMEDFVEPDRCELEKLMHKSGINCVAYLYNHGVDARKSGLNRRVHNGALISKIASRLGTYAPQFMKNVGLDKSDSPAAWLRGTTYTPEILNMGKFASGYCLYRDNDVLMLYSAGVSEALSVQNFYHEMSHVLQHKLKFDEFDQKFLNVWAKRANNSTGKARQSAIQIYNNEQEYLSYMSETQAELFGATMMLLRVRTESEFQKVRETLIKHAAMRMYFGRGNKSLADYNYIRPLMKVVDQLSALGRRGRMEFGKENGRFSLEKVAKFTFETVKNNMLSRDEYHTYKNSNEPLEQLIQQKWGEPKYGWLEEAGVCENVVSRYAQDLNVYAFANALTKAKSRRQMYDAFMDYQDVVPEAANLYELYKQHNPKGRYYDKLRKTEENLGVDKLFGEFAKKRRDLGAKIMSHLSGGR